MHVQKVAQEQKTQQHVLYTAALPACLQHKSPATAFNIKNKHNHTTGTAANNCATTCLVGSPALFRKPHNPPAAGSSHKSTMIHKGYTPAAGTA